MDPKMPPRGLGWMGMRDLIQRRDAAASDRKSRTAKRNWIRDQTLAQFPIVRLGSASASVVEEAAAAQQ